MCLEAEKLSRNGYHKYIARYTQKNEKLLLIQKDGRRDKWILPLDKMQLSTDRHNFLVMRDGDPSNCAQEGGYRH